MQVVFIFIGDFVIEGRIHLFHINAAGGYIGGYQHIKFIVAVGRHNAVAGRLFHIPIKALGAQPGLFQMCHQADSAVFGIAEYHAAAVFLPFQQVDERFNALPAAALDAVLGDAGFTFRYRLHHQLHRIQLVQPTNIHNLAGNGGGKHRHLLGARHPVQNPAHILIETHIQHFVRFIQHNHFGAVDGNIASAHMVHQAAGGGHYNLRILAKGVNLRLHGLPAVHRHNGKTGDIFAQLLQLLGNLQAELPGGAKDNPLHIAFFRLDTLYHRHTKSAGFPGAGGGLGNDLFAGQQFRDRFLLNFGHLSKTHLRDCLFHLLADGQFLVICRHDLLPFTPVWHTGFSIFSCPANIIASLGRLFNGNPTNSPHGHSGVVCQ